MCGVAVTLEKGAAVAQVPAQAAQDRPAQSVRGTDEQADAYRPAKESARVEEERDRQLPARKLGRRVA